MITQKFNIYLHAGIAFAPVVHCSQYSQGETWTFTILDNDGSVYRPSSGALIGVKSDGNVIAGITGTVNSDGSVSIVTTQQLTAAAGRGIFELTIDGGTNGTANFIVEVEPKPTDGGVLSESDLSIIQQGINSVTPAVITETVSDYLSEHMTNPPIDPTLTVSNAAADAKVTGDEITDLKNAFDDITENANLFDKNTATLGMRIGTNGYEYTDSNAFLSAYIPVEVGKKYQKNSPTIDGLHRMATYNSSNGVVRIISDSNTVTIQDTETTVRFCGLLTEIDSATFLGEPTAIDSVARETSFNVENTLNTIDAEWKKAFQDGVIYKNVAFEQGAFTNKNENQASTTRLRSTNLIDFSEYENVTIELDEGYKIIRLDYDGTPPYDMTAWRSEGYTFGVESGILYRFGLAKTDDGTISADESIHVRFKVAEIPLNDLEETMYQIRDTRPTYVILDFDQDIESLDDNRVTLVNEQYGYPFSFVGVTQPSVTKELLGRGCDLSIYSNASGYLPNVSTINSDSETDILAWDRYVKEVLDRYNDAGFYNQVCWSCQGMNYGSALEKALKKYGFKMARGNEVGGTYSIYIDSFDDNSFRVGCYQIYTNNPSLAVQQVTNAVNNGQDICVFTHKIVDTAEEDRGYDCTKEAYTTFLEGLKTKVEAGQVKVVTFREYYKMHCPKSNYEYDYNRIFKTIWHTSE